MVELVEEALGEYLGWNRMTKIEKDELERYRIAERDGPGRSAHANFGYLSNNLAEAPVLAQLLEYLHGKYLVVRVNDGQTGFRDFSTFKEGKVCLSNRGGALELQLTIPGRRRFEQLQAREAWETTGTRVDR